MVLQILKIVIKVHGVWCSRETNQEDKYKWQKYVTLQVVKNCIRKQPLSRNEPNKNVLCEAKSSKVTILVDET